MKVLVYAKFVDNDAEHISLDAEEVELSEGGTLGDLVRTAVEQLRDVIPPDSIRIVVSKQVAADELARVRAIRLPTIKCESADRYVMRFLRPDDQEEKHYTFSQSQLERDARETEPTPVSPVTAEHPKGGGESEEPLTKRHRADDTVLDSLKPASTRPPSTSGNETSTLRDIQVMRALLGRTPLTSTPNTLVASSMSSTADDHTSAAWQVISTVFDRTPPVLRSLPAFESPEMSFDMPRLRDSALSDTPTRVHANASAIDSVASTQETPAHPEEALQLTNDAIEETLTSNDQAASEDTDQPAGGDERTDGSSADETLVDGENNGTLIVNGTHGMSTLAGIDEAFEDSQASDDRSSITSAPSHEASVDGSDADDELSTVADEAVNPGEDNEALIRKDDASNVVEEPSDYYVSDTIDHLTALLKAREPQIILDTADFVGLEDPTYAPVYWISKWFDYSDKYGLGYQLCDNSVGVLYNDCTKLVVDAAGEQMQYVDRMDKEYYHTTLQYPPELEKKVKLIRSFRDYMNSLVKADDNYVSREGAALARLPSLVTWLRNKIAILFLLNNVTIQVNFVQDHTKLVICPLKQTITFVDTSRVFRTYKFSQMEQKGCPDELYPRLEYAKKMLEKDVHRRGAQGFADFGSP